METIEITDKIIGKLNKAIKASLEFEKLTGKQLNITSIVGEVLVCLKLGLKLVKDDINAGYDAIDSENKRVQIKTRRYKNTANSNTAMTGNLLTKKLDVPYDYVILILLEIDYTLKAIYKIEKNEIEGHFIRINGNRIIPRKNMSIGQFIKLNSKNK